MRFTEYELNVGDAIYLNRGLGADAGRVSGFAQAIEESNSNPFYHRACPKQNLSKNFAFSSELSIFDLSDGILSFHAGALFFLLAFPRENSDLRC